MPGQTLDEFCHLDASALEPLDELDEGEAMETLSVMESSGVGPSAIAEALQREGVQKFAESFDSLLHSIRSKATAPSNR